MRTIFVTGQGGSGRTTAAAATALAAARGGTRTLLLTADRTDTLGAVLGVPTGPGPIAVAPGLDALRTAPADTFRQGLLTLQDRAAAALDLLGAARLDADELTPLPGSDELALLHAVRDGVRGPHDLLVVDLPPAPQALALLALPAQLRRYLRRLLPPERQAARALRPLLGRLAGIPLPAEWLYESAARLDAELTAVQEAIDAPGTAVRLVAEPTAAATEALRTTATGLALHGLRTETLLATRVLPGGSADPWLAEAAARQRGTVAAWAESHPVHVVEHLGRDPRGTDDLAALGVPAPAEPASGAAWHVEDGRDDAGGRVLVWHIPLPGAVRDDLGLLRWGDELIVTVGDLRRVVPLPSALRRCTVAGAGLREGELRVRFTPDPGLWPRTP